jgi:hypothetical protein
MGVGINDAWYMVKPIIQGKRYYCPYYSKWHGMINRCYWGKYHDKKPTYRDCTVCDEWLRFSVFKKWMTEQDWKGKELDKDIIKPGNKIYSPENCRFVTSELNILLSDSIRMRGQHPRGVTLSSRCSSYAARVNDNGKPVTIGYFSTPELASDAYVEAKSLLIHKAANNQKDPAIAAGLMLHAKLLNA